MQNNTTKTNDVPEEKYNQRQKQNLAQVAHQIEMAMQSDKTPQGVKDCLYTIIFEASNEAGLPLGDMSLVRSAFPNIIENLDEGYGRGVYHSIHAVLIHNTSAFKDFYEQRLDEKSEPEKQAKTESERKANRMKFDSSTVINEPELEKLLDGFLTDAQFHPYAVYGLMFLFSSIRRLLDNDCGYRVHDYCDRALDLLYPQSFNMDYTIKRFEKNLHLAYRAADFTSDNFHDISKPFLDLDCPEQVENKESKPILDLSEMSAKDLETDDLDELANQLSAAMKNPLLPTNLYNVMTDELTENPYDTDSAEWIRASLQAQIEKSKEASND